MILDEFSYFRKNALLLLNSLILVDFTRRQYTSYSIYDANLRYIYFWILLTVYNTRNSADIYVVNRINYLYILYTIILEYIGLLQAVDTRANILYTYLTKTISSLAKM